MARVNVFSGNPLDRAGNERRNAEWVQARLQEPGTRFLPMWQLRPLMQLGEPLSIGWLGHADVANYLADGASCILLGLKGDVAHFAIDVSAAGPKKADAPFKDLGKWIDVRSAATSATGADAGILAQARSMLNWHDRHGFCAVCGSPSSVSEAGYSRRCNNESCKAMHFPRTDPVAIMLVLDGDRALLGRQKIFAPLSYSALAGFMEPGETIEETVRREVKEEAGLEVGAVRYVSSQPWPFPSSLMIGCHADAITTDIKVDPDELEEARWFTRDQVREMVANCNDSTKLRTPAPLAIAHQLCLAWLGVE